MVVFRRCMTVLAVLALFAGLAAAQGSGSQTPLTCSTNVTGTPTLRAESYTENTGDIIITCTGGPNTAVGTTIPSVNIQIFLNTQVTSRLLNTNNNASEALLLIDEPGGTLPAAVGTGQPFGPQAPQSVCTTPTTGCTEFVSSVVAGPGAPAAFVGLPINVATDTAQGTTATSNGKNVFQGIVSGNSVTFFGVPILAPGTTGISRTLRFTNIRANATALGGGSAAGTTPVVAQITVSNPAALPISTPTPTVGFVQSGLTTGISSSLASLQQCNGVTRAFVSTLFFRENFGSSFKTRVVPGSGVNSGQGTGAPQNVPGTIYAAESNFILTAAGLSSNGSATAGLADWGTRLKATFNNVPTGVRLFVSVNNVLNGNAGPVPVPSPIGGNDFTNSYAQAIAGGAELAAENSGAGGFPLATTSNTLSNGITITEIPVGATGTATAVWEVVNTNPTSIETFRFAVYTTFTSNVATNSPPAGTSSVNLSFAPTPPAFTATSGPTASASNVPRFAVSSGTASNIFSINICRTILLYPFVTNQAGFDTGLAIANTSTDPFGTGPQAGTCTLNWYSGATNPPPTTTASIASGTVYTALASITVSGFQGYMIAVCNFQYAHGFAFISDLGARNLAMGYLAVVIGDPSSQANAVRNASAVGCGVGDIPCGAGEADGH